MLEQESNVPTIQTSEGGAGDADARKKRRRRRGKRRPDGQESPEQEATGQTDAPVSKSAEPAKPADEDASRRSKRGKRRRPERTTAPDGEVQDKSASTQTAAPKSAPAQPGEQPRPSLAKPVGAKQVGAKQPGAKPVGTRSAGRGNNRRDKAEPEPRGSVLQRRLNREAKARDEDDVDDLMPAPAPVNVNTVDAYVAQLRGWQREVVTKLRAIVRSQAQEATEDILWSQPVYSINGPIVYIKAFTDHVNLGFWRGNEVDDPQGRLTGELPTMRHFTIRHVSEVDRELFESYVRSAVKLDRDKGDATA